MFFYSQNILLLIIIILSVKVCEKNTMKEKQTSLCWIIMINAIRLIAERKISEAIRNGQLDIKGWRNKPLPITNDNLIPEELRMAHKILKNAGYLPPEIETKKEIQQIEDLLATCEDECTRVKQIKKLNYLVMKLNTMKGDTVNIESQEEYYRQVVERLTVNKSASE